MMPNRPTLTNLEKLDETALLELARGGDASALWLITKQNNRRLYRIARAMLGNDHEAEDVVQETYLRAFPKLGQFREEASLSTWLTPSGRHGAGRELCLPSRARRHGRRELPSRGRWPVRPVCSADPPQGREQPGARHAQE